MDLPQPSLRGKQRHALIRGTAWARLRIIKLWPCSCVRTSTDIVLHIHRLFYKVFGTVCFVFTCLKNTIWIKLLRQVEEGLQQCDMNNIFPASNPGFYPYMSLKVVSNMTGYSSCFASKDCAAVSPSSRWSSASASPRPCRHLGRETQGYTYIRYC